jgi:uncharacterized repeat protein (TIGR01451 family)
VRTGFAALLVGSALLVVGPAGAGSVGNGVIAFDRDFGVWTIDPTTRVERNLTADVPGLAHGYGPFAWSPDGTRLAYGGAVEVSPNSYRSTPAVMNADGTGKRRLVDDLSRYFAPACWLSDDTIALESSEPDLSSTDLWTVKPDGTDLRALTSDGGQKSYVRCSQSTDRVFFQRTANGDSVPYYVSGDGGAPVRLEPDGIAPIPSPDGSRLAFMRSDGVFVENLDGSGLTKVSDSYQGGYGLIWSPDGRWLAFPGLTLIGYFRTIAQYTNDVHIVAANGVVEHKLTTDPGGDVPIAWSPDGTRILYSSSTRGLSVMNADGTCQTSLMSTNDYMEEDAAAWQPVPGRAAQAPIMCVDLGVKASADPSQVGIGGTVRYQFTVTNDGSETASDVAVAGSALPPNTAPVAIFASQGSCSLAPMTCHLGSLASAASAAVTVRLTSAFSGPASSVSLAFGVTVSAPEPESDPTNNNAIASATAYPCTTLGTSGPDLLKGTPGDDSLCGLSSADRIYGLAGRDAIYGGPGTDTIHAGPGRDVIFGGGENDTIFAHDGEPDRVDCGAGRDTVIADPTDSLVDCEVVSRGPVACSRVGTVGADRIVGTTGDDRICGLPGNDTIDGLAGADQIDGGDGNDTIDAGPGRDRIFGGAGYDVILARDGEPDTIDCGTQVDTVIADRLDRVARNCEHVQRRE